MSKIEEWRILPGYNGKYEVSNQERFRCNNYKMTGETVTYDKSSMLQPSKSRPYYSVHINNRTAYFHILVAKAFPEICGVFTKGMNVHHINHDKTDNRPENLKSITVSEHRRLHPVSDEQRQELSNRYKGENNPFYGKHHSDETREKFCRDRKGRQVWNKGKKMSDEYRRINSECHKNITAGERNGMYGRHRTEAEKEALRAAHSKPIIQLTTDGVFVNRFPSVKSAIEATGISNISKCALGKYQSAGGYVWKYETDTTH